MRPRSKLLSKRRLILPTITEGNEETLKELNGVNSLHNSDQSQAVSSEDYLLSICHLARPTRDVSLDSLHTQQPNAVLRKLRPSQLIRTTLTTFDLNLTEEARVTLEEQADEGELNKSLMCGNADPLEYLYGHQNNISAISGSVRRRFGRQHGRASGAESGLDFPCQHRSSETHTNSSALNVSPKHNRSEVRKVCQEGRGADGERLSPEIKQSLISQWISDCRSAWREARARACVLPAIAEV
ncbi:uncharacterized protein si:dkeyp-72g9.4 [Oryzias melastigma]|uniref:uncharacterized protein si:dkeyp-72g9.4 n=1 Tax=Oryzias melastigma TaxID=30732 RepID=UPI000CF82115|nr:uncharacterized protein si:dkeyp-72g9.4 [Oryzias melastigma]